MHQNRLAARLRLQHSRKPSAGSMGKGRKGKKIRSEQVEKWEEERSGKEEEGGEGM